MELSIEQKVKINNSIKELYKKQEECGKKGHKSNSEEFSYGSGKMNGICENCGEWYERYPTSEETIKYLKKLRETYSIKLILN